MLATFDDLVAIGAIPDNTSTLAKYGVRATRLIELATSQVCAYLRSSEVVIRAALADYQLTALAAVVAECAGSRLNVSAAPSSDPYGTVDGIKSAMLNRWHKSQIDMIVGTTLTGTAAASLSFDVARDDASTYLNPVPGDYTDLFFAYPTIDPEFR